MEKIIETKSLGVLKIRCIPKHTAKDIIVKNHYSHKWNNPSFGVYNFGIFYENKAADEQGLGVAAYGYLKNPKAGIFTHPNPQAWICELNRMWIDDCLGRNAESILIAHSLKMLRKLDKNIVAVQSFADGRLGCGTIYKAANFRYFGWHYTRFLKNIRTSEISHEQNFSNSKNKSTYLRNNIGFLLKDYRVFRVKTHRYIYIFDKKVKLRFKEVPYPPYEKSEEPCEWERNNNKIIDRMTDLLQYLKTD